MNTFIPLYEVTDEHLDIIKIHLSNMREYLGRGHLRYPNTKKRFTDEVNALELFISEIIQINIIIEDLKK